MNRLTQLISIFALGFSLTACPDPINPTPSTPDFNLLLMPNSLTIAAGASNQTIVAITPTNGFMTDIALTLEGNVVGTSEIQVAGEVNVMTPISGTVTLSVGASVAAGTYKLTVRATAGSLNHTAPLALTVTSSTTPTQDFSLALTPANLSVAVGTSGQTTLTVTPTNGFNATVDLLLEGTVVGTGLDQVQGEFVASNATTSLLTISVGSSVTAGTYILTVSGTSSSLNHTTQLSLTVTSGGTQTPPQIASLPAVSARGVVTTITGSNFGTTQGSSSVSFGGVNAAQILTWTDTQITVIVPSTISVGSSVSVVVTTSGGTNQMATRVIKPVTIAAGLSHSLALTPNGGVVAWGDNGKGQLNVPSSAQSGIVSIAGNQLFGLALNSSGGVFGWGDNGNGQTTIPASASSDVMAISAGDGHALALKTDGSVIAWGYNINKQATVPAGAFSGVVAISAGGSYSLALKTDGTVIAWGNLQSYPLPASASSNVASLESGTSHALAIKTDGSVVGWGDTTSGRIAIPAEASSGIAAVSAGFDHSLILKDDSSVLAFGGNANGQTTIPSAAQTGVAAIAAGNRFSLAIKTDGSVVAWGANDKTQINVPSGLIAAIP
jgi:Regulator of chromosome condensation (RCC1) repeat/IPT/TIG domain